MIYDCLIIGAGVMGSFLARDLSKYKLNVAVIERSDDLCSLQSKANSAIVHQGFDPIPGTLKARLNTEGARVFEKITKELSVPYKRCGALVASTSGSEGQQALKQLVDRAFKNRCFPVIILSARKAHRIEPNLADDVDSVLYAPFSAIVDPFLLVIRACESAYKNSVEFFLNTKAIGFEKESDVWIVKTSNREFRARVVINAAGIYSDELNNMVSQNKYEHTPRRGDYMVLHKSQNYHVKHTIFALPSSKGKGILVTPSTAGNILLGPTNYAINDKEGSNVTQEGMDEIITKTAINVKNIDYKRVIRTFAGVRSHEKKGDFIIEEAVGGENFISLVGMESPGLTAAPAVAKYVVDNFVSKKFDLKPKNDWNGAISKEPFFAQLKEKQKIKLISQNPLYKNIICKCEYITEAEVVNSITRPLGARTLEGVKKRTRCMMGLCQGGYCQRFIENLIEKHLEDGK